MFGQRKESYDNEIYGLSEPCGWWNQENNYHEQIPSNDDFQANEEEKVTPQIRKSITKNRRYSKEDDQKIIELVNYYGRKWKLIASHFPDKNQRMLRNRFLKLTRQSTELLQLIIQDEDDTFQSLNDFKNQTYSVSSLSNIPETETQVKFLSHQVNMIEKMVIQTKQQLFSHLLGETFNSVWQKIGVPQIQIPANADKPYQIAMMTNLLKQKEVLLSSI